MIESLSKHFGFTSKMLDSFLFNYWYDYWYWQLDWIQILDHNSSEQVQVYQQTHR